jgi:hypothetical protein
MAKTRAVWWVHRRKETLRCVGELPANPLFMGIGSKRKDSLRVADHVAQTGQVKGFGWNVKKFYVLDAGGLFRG